MRKFITVFAILVVTISLYSFKKAGGVRNTIQSLHLEVSYSFQRNNYTSDYELLTNQSIALWEEVSDLLPNSNANINFERSGKYMRKKTYTSLTDSLMLSKNEIMKQQFFIEEKVVDLNWELVDSSEVILGYNCSMAKLNFRGREYIAFYTSDILTSIGPWKFHGLPGLILKVESYSFNEYYKIEAQELKMLKEPSKDYSKNFNKFRKRNKRKFQSWLSFEKDINKFINRVIRYHKSNFSNDENDDGKSGFRLINYLEIFHPSQKETIWYD